MRSYSFFFKTKFIAALLLLSALNFSHAAAAEALHPFKASSLAQIQSARAGKPFILLLWSLDCPSCMKEMGDISKAMAKHPELDLVMVATDEESYGKEVQEVLAKHGLQKAEAWIFADSNAQGLRYEIDPAWFGELPRSYFYDPAHKRLPHSGVLGIQQIEAWLAVVKP